MPCHLLLFVLQPRSNGAFLFLGDGPFLRTWHGNLSLDEDRISLDTLALGPRLRLTKVNNHFLWESHSQRIIKFIVHDTYCDASVTERAEFEGRRWKGIRVKKMKNILALMMTMLSQSEFFISMKSGSRTSSAHESGVTVTRARQIAFKAPLSSICWRLHLISHPSAMSSCVKS